MLKHIGIVGCSAAGRRFVIKRYANWENKSWAIISTLKSLCTRLLCRAMLNV